MKAVSPPHDAMVCNYSLDEMRRVYNRKFPHKIPDFERFLSLPTLSVEIVSTPKDIGEGVRGEQKICDLNGRPIYLAALAAVVDGILTGDKDFLDSGTTCPRMLKRLSLYGWVESF